MGDALRSSHQKERRQDHDDPFDRLLQKRLVEDMTSAMTRQPIRERQGGKSNKTVRDEEMVVTLTRRLRIVESTLTKHIQELKQKEDELQKMQRSVHEQKELESRLMALEKENSRLRLRLGGMDDFLADYGLIWAGNTDSSDNDDNDDNDSDDDDNIDTKDDDDPVVDMRAIRANIADLNILAGEGSAEITKDRDGLRRLRPTSPLHLTFYRNGIIVGEGPFRAFSTTEAQGFVRDILDGYFPIELKAKYPEGVPFHLQDLSHTFYEAPFSAFGGCGQKLQSKNQADETSFSPFRRTSATDAFLKRLPATVIKSGKIVPIRSEIAERLGKESSETAPTPDVVIVPSPVMDALKQSAQSEGPQRPRTPRNTIATLRIRATTGRPLYLAKLHYDDTIGTLRACLDKVYKGEPFELRTNVPSVAYNDTAQTLRQAGLVPNAVLHMRALG